MSTKYDGLEIAIIGMSGQFPGSPDYRSYWQNVRDGKDLIRRFTDEELLGWGVPESDLTDPSYVKAFGVVDDKDCFDHQFFGYTPDEALLMDPQIRLLHENCWSALEDAGYTSLIEKQKIGLFAGAARNDNWKVYAYQKSEEARLDPFYRDMITNHIFISTLIAYKLNLRANSSFVDTACSTSLSAVHQACRSLLFGECRMALAGAVTLFSHKPKGYLHQEGMIYSPDGHCRPFDKDSDGTVGSEGVGVVVLKKLTDAIKDGDHVYCIIRATAANNDGSQKVGYTAPSVKGQADCIRTAHRIAGVSPHSISYVEAHGTATKLGDPVEVRALNEAFATSGEKYCGIGSVKSNIGHTDTAAGVAGLMKVALSLKHRQLPPSLHYQSPNPGIDFEGGPFYVNATLKNWERKNDAPLRAGVSSFGIGGTNVHAVLEEAPRRQPGSKGRSYKLLTLSAKTEEAVARYMGRMRDFLVASPDVDLADMSYTLQVGRKHFEYRKSIVYREKDELLDLLGGTGAPATRTDNKHKQVVFMFSGAGSQYANMGKDLYDGEPFFREEMDKGFALLGQMTGINYKDILYPPLPDDARINVMLHTQPLIFVFGYSLARLLMSWGVEPHYMIGHSIGEYIAACLSGVFSYEDALKLVVARGQLMNDMPRGGMVSASISEAEALRFVDDRITIAALNGSEQVVFSGDLAAIDALVKQLEGQDISCVRLYTSHAGHSCMIDEIVPAYREVVKSVRRNAPGIPFISNLTAGRITPAEAESVEYWLRHMRQTVQFSEGIRTLAALNKEMVFVEIGGGHALTTLVKQQQKDIKPFCLNLVRHPKEPTDDQRHLADATGRLWEYGVDVNWNLYYANQKRGRVSLPTYPYEQHRYPAMVTPQMSGLPQLSGDNTAGNTSLKDWIYYPAWKTGAPLAESRTNRERTYLFFSQDDEWCGHVRTLLEKEPGANVVEVTKGNTYQKSGPGRYLINPGDRDQYEALFKDLRQDGVAASDVVYAWGMHTGPQPLSLEEGDAALDCLFFGPVHLVRALAAQADRAAKNVFVLTDSLHRVTGAEKVRYAQALMLGLVNTVPQEYGVPCCNIDVNREEDSRAVAGKVVREIGRFRGEDRVVALRHGQRWVQDYLKNTRALEPNEPVVRTGGTYLVTGGLGNLGMVLCEHLLRTYDVQLVIVGRTKLADAGGNAGAYPGESAGRLGYLQGINGKTAYFTADVSDLAAVRTAAREIERRFGAVHGIIHAAGNANTDSFELIEDITGQQTMELFGAKVQGLLNLYEVFREAAPDFVWVSSSLATVLSGISYCAYASANLFTDYFVASLAGQLPGWKCVGLSEMQFAPASAESARQPQKALLPHDIIRLFEWSLSLPDCPLVLETVEDLEARLRRVYGARESSDGQAHADGPAIKKVERPLVSTAYAAPATGVEKKLAGMVEALFGIANIGMEDGFFELGGDSLKAMVLLKRIKKEFEVTIPIKDFFTYTSLRQVAGAVENQLWINRPSEKKFVAII